MPDIGEDWQADSLRTLGGISGLSQMLQQAAELALELPGAQSAGVSLISGRSRIETMAATDEVAGKADALQVELGSGPLFDAIQLQVVVYLDDIANERRWPDWAGRVVADLGIRSMLSFQLFTDDNVLGSLNLYSSRPRAFNLDVLNTGYLFAAHVGVAISQIREKDSLKSAIATRTIIGQAEGILMERFGLDGDAAFNALRRVSQTRNVKLRDVAAELVRTRRLEGLSADDGAGRTPPSSS